MTERETDGLTPTGGSLVLHVIPTPRARGAQREARALADHLDVPGIRNHRVLALFAGAPEVAVDASLDHPGGDSPAVGFDPRLVLSLRSVLARMDPELVVAHGSEPLKYLVTAMIGRRRPIVYYAIGTYSGSANGMQRRLWRFLMSQSDAIAAEGQEVHDECIAMFGVPSHRVTVTPNGRNPDEFHPREESAASGPPRIAFVGALTEGKGPDRFIDVVAGLRTDDLEFGATLIGDGPLHQSLGVPAAVNHVEMLGSRSDVADQLRKADVMVFPSRPAGEGMPGVLIEAGLSGIPVVATEVPGARSVVDDGVTGFIVPVDDVEAMVAATGRLLRDPLLRSSMGRAARFRCEDTFSLAAVGQRWMTILQPLLDGTTTGRSGSGRRPRAIARSADRSSSVSPAPAGGGSPPTLDGLPDPRTRRQWVTLFTSSALRSWHGPDFSEVDRFCFFIGYARSGHTLVATLLNAHPDMVIAHELDAARYVRHGFTRSQLFSLLLERDQQFGSIGRTWSGYQYEVPGQFQGRFERLRVIGDKRARSSVLQIAQRPQLLDRIRRVVQVPLRVIHVTRNPFDNIATEARRHNMSLTEATRWYEDICQAVKAVRPMLAPDELVDIRYEDFAGHTVPELTRLCQFVGVEAEPAYLEACADIVWAGTKQTRHSVEWSMSERAAVERLIEQYDVLSSYTFDR